MKTKPPAQRDKRAHLDRGGKRVTASVGTYPKPLEQKRVFLNLTKYREHATFESQLKLLGAVVEKCFSKDVNLVITTQGKVSDYGRPKSDKGASTSAATPSPFNLAALRGTLDSPVADSPGGADGNKPLTRGQKIAKQANLAKKYGSIDVLKNAEKWKIKIVHVDQAQDWVQKQIKNLPDEVVRQHRTKDAKETKKHKGPTGNMVRRLKGPFLKVEAVNRMYRPWRKEFEGNFPKINLSSPQGSFPFDTVALGLDVRGMDERAERCVERDTNEQPGLEELDTGTGTGSHRPTLRNGTSKKSSKQPSRKKMHKSGEDAGYFENLLYTPGDWRRMMREKAGALQKAGFCEQCEVHYVDIDKHVRCDQHRDFVRNSENYSSLDSLIEQGPNIQRFLADVERFQLEHQQEAVSCAADADGTVLLNEQGTPHTRNRLRQCALATERARRHSASEHKDTKELPTARTSTPLTDAAKPAAAVANNCPDAGGNAQLCAAADELSPELTTGGTGELDGSRQPHHHKTRTAGHASPPNDQRNSRRVLGAKNLSPQKSASPAKNKHGTARQHRQTKPIAGTENARQLRSSPRKKPHTADCGGTKTLRVSPRKTAGKNRQCCEKESAQAGSTLHSDAGCVNQGKLDVVSSSDNDSSAATSARSTIIMYTGRFQEPGAQTLNKEEPRAQTVSVTQREPGAHADPVTHQEPRAQAAAEQPTPATSHQEFPVIGTIYTYNVAAPEVSPLELNQISSKCLQTVGESIAAHVKDVPPPSKRRRHLKFDNEESEDEPADDCQHQRKKMKLKHNWSVISQQSVSRMFSSSSEHSFDGFPKQPQPGTDSDMSYDELSEVEMSDKWHLPSNVAAEQNSGGSKKLLPQLAQPRPVLQQPLFGLSEPSSEWDKNLDSYLEDQCQRKIKEGSVSISLASDTTLLGNTSKSKPARVPTTTTPSAKGVLDKAFAGILGGEIQGESLWEASSPRAQRYSKRTSLVAGCDDKPTRKSKGDTDKETKRLRQPLTNPPRHSTPVRRRPSTPVRRRPSSPSRRRPSTPSRQRPSTPSRNRPSTPSRNRPSRGRPSTPSRHKLSTPSQRRPSTPSRSGPSTPVRRGRSTPSKLKPSTPNRSSMVGKALSTPVRHQPSTPVRRERSNSVRQGRSPPVKPINSAALRRQAPVPLGEQSTTERLRKGQRGDRNARRRDPSCEKESSLTDWSVNSQLEGSAQIDDDIAFNFSSPQKIRGQNDMSPRLPSPIQPVTRTCASGKRSRSLPACKVPLRDIKLGSPRSTRHTIAKASPTPPKRLLKSASTTEKSFSLDFMRGSQKKKKKKRKAERVKAEVDGDQARQAEEHDKSAEQVKGQQRCMSPLSPLSMSVMRAAALGLRSSPRKKRALFQSETPPASVSSTCSNTSKTSVNKSLNKSLSVNKSVSKPDQTGHSNGQRKPRGRLSMKSHSVQTASNIVKSYRRGSSKMNTSFVGSPPRGQKDSVAKRRSMPRQCSSRSRSLPGKGRSPRRRQAKNKVCYDFTSDSGF